MRFQTALILVTLTLTTGATYAYVPGRTPNGAIRHWTSGTIAVQFTGPTTVDGQTVHDAALAAMASWNAIDAARIDLRASTNVDRTEPAIGNGDNELGWVESSDSPYFIPGVACTTATIYDTLTGVMIEADTTCNAMAYQWPSDMFGLYTQDGVVDAESAVLAAFGYWLGLDTSLDYADPMYPELGSGAMRRVLSSDNLAFARHQYGDGTSQNGTIAGTVRFPDGTPVPYAYVLATVASGTTSYGAVANAGGGYTIFEPVAGSYTVVVRPLTTDPYIVSSVPYRANPIGNLDFTPEFYGGGQQVQVQNGATTSGIDITVFRSGSQPDANEPNDGAGSAAPLVVGFSRVAGAHVRFDDDWYWFQTAPNTCYLAATAFHGASIVPVRPGDPFWSRTRLLLYDGGVLLGRNESKDDYQQNPGSWITFCETGSSRRLDVEVQQREGGGGPGFFYSVSAMPVSGGPTRTPTIDGLYPNAGWSHRNRFVLIDGADFMPGAIVEVRLPNATWVAASQVVATGCDATYRCNSLKALFPTASPGVADVRVTNPNGRSVIKAAAFTYLASGVGPLTDRTPSAFGNRYGSGQAVCIGDYDGDGNDDILKTRTSGLPYQLFRSNGGDSFTDVAASAGLHMYSSVLGASCSWIDVDDDGDLDAYITNRAYSLPTGAANELYVNHLAGGSASFTLGTPTGMSGASTRYKSDAAWADFDNDGRLDMVLSYDAYAGSAPYLDAVQYFRQNPNGSFTEATNSSGLSGYVASITSVKAADFDNDRCDDLVFFTHDGIANRLYRGDCHGHFTDFTSQSKVAEGSPWCTGVAIADFNNDGTPDMFCGSYNAGGGPERPRLWLNDGSARFTDRASDAGLYAVARNMDVVVALDGDNDGLNDVFIGASENGWLDDRKDVFLKNTGGNPPVFVDMTDAAGMYPTTADGSGYCGPGVGEYYCDRDASAGGVFDWKHDGSLDVFVTGTDPDFLQRGADFLWYNRRHVASDGTVVPAGDWIDVGLKGANTPQSRVLSNRFGIGALVTVIPRFNLPGGSVPTETQCLQNPLPSGVIAYGKEVLAGNRSQSSMALHFGLGSSLPFGQKRVDCIRVAWPSGIERAYTGITANNTVVLAEDVGRMKVIKVSPNSGPNTRSDPTTIIGMRFDRDLVAVPQVLFGSVPALSVTFVSERELVVRPPLWQPPGTVDITVVNTNGERDTLLAGYSFTGSSDSVRFKEPVPSLLSAVGVVSADPEFVATRGDERSGVVADGVTELVFESEVAGPGQVRFALDDDDDAADAPPSATDVGSMTLLSGGASQVTLTVTVNRVADGRYIGHAIYTAPQEFIRTTADELLASRPIRVRATFIDALGVESAMPPRWLNLYRVPVLYVHGMWGSDATFRWPVVNDPRWLSHRADYSDSNDVGFGQNAGVPPRIVAELKKKIRDQGIAGTRVFVFAHSMGAVLFKIYMAGAGAPYARADNFFAGDVYALVPVDAPLFGSPLAAFVRQLGSLPAIGLPFVTWMRSAGLSVDNGCMASLDPTSGDMRDIPAVAGRFHAMTGWGGREIRAASVDGAVERELYILEGALRLFGLAFDQVLLPCGEGDDFVVCTDSQQGGLAAGHVDNFHYADWAAKAIHFDSVSKELAPSAAAERLLNTPIASDGAWGPLLPQAPPSPLVDVADTKSGPDEKQQAVTASGIDGIPLALSSQGDDILLSWSGAATRLWKSLTPTLAAGVCLAVSGESAVDAHQRSVPANSYYVVGASSLCTPTAALSIASVSPSSGSSMGGYMITILGVGFGPTTKVKIGPFYAGDVTVVNATTLSCRMVPGAPGGTTMTVTNGPGVSASLPFQFIDPGVIPGSAEITSPQDGAVVAAGSTIAVSAMGVGGFTIAQALVAVGRASSDVDRDGGPGFSTTVAVPVDAIGPITIDLLSRDVRGNVKRANPVTIIAIVPGDVSLVRLDAERVILLDGTPARQLGVHGIYTDGIQRDVTHAAGIRYEMDTQDPRKPNYPYNGTGVAVVDANGLITAKTRGTTICHVTYSGRTIDVVVEVAEVRPTMTIQKPGFISWPYQGPSVTYDLVRGKLSMLRATRGRYADPSIGMSCIKDNFANVTAADAANPPSGDGYFYLMRESTTRSYDESPFWPTRSQVGQRTTEINAGPGACQ